MILFDETIRRGPAERYTAELEPAPDAPVPGGSMILAEHPHRVERTCLTLAGPASEGWGVATPPAPARRASRGVARGGHLWTASACRPRDPLEGAGPGVRGRCRDRSRRAGCGAHLSLRRQPRHVGCRHRHHVLGGSRAALRGLWLAQLGRAFPGITWVQGNGRFRDDLRRFVRGDGGMVPALMRRLCGSDDLFPDDRASAYHPYQDVNFATSHDGFTLWDLVSYERKRNRANGV